MTVTPLYPTKASKEDNHACTIFQGSRQHSISIYVQSFRGKSIVLILTTARFKLNLSNPFKSGFWLSTKQVLTCYLRLHSTLGSKIKIIEQWNSQNFTSRNEILGGYLK